MGHPQTRSGRTARPRWSAIFVPLALAVVVIAGCSRDAHSDVSPRGLALYRAYLLKGLTSYQGIDRYAFSDEILRLDLGVFSSSPSELMVDYHYSDDLTMNLEDNQRFDWSPLIFSVFLRFGEADFVRVGNAVLSDSYADRPERMEELKLVFAEMTTEFREFVESSDWEALEAEWIEAGKDLPTTSLPT